MMSTRFPARASAAALRDGRTTLLLLQVSYMNNLVQRSCNAAHQGNAGRAGAQEPIVGTGARVRNRSVDRGAVGRRVPNRECGAAPSAAPIGRTSAGHG